ncbi:hypothetical protein DFO55_12414 [Grimontella sp. AG753]|nr:hypothetical protein DFO55_12414 [Grimontella sp. AG753]
MKVIAKFRTVEVTYPDGDVVNFKCKSIKDALEFASRFSKVIPFRHRASTDKTYLSEFYKYLQSKGYVETERYESQMRLYKKLELVRKISQGWALES